ncbi:MAG: SpoIID/LytB domain-containing protein, partial [Bacteroidales bacterium]|nr:SpoIID/LytB domain-containing protein [Bacteroidales bacterium]
MKPQAQQPEPTISVGIVHADHIVIELRGTYRCLATNATMTGLIEATTADGHVLVNGQEADRWILSPNGDSCRFTIRDVEIGIGFHWDKREDQVFGGGLRFAVEDGKVWAVNVIGVESYLTSVISSEMSATSDLELLKAHAVTSRSWLMAQVWGKGKFLGEQKSETEGEIVT